MSSLNTDISLDDIIQGFHLRKEYEQRFDREPIFTHARSTLDKVNNNNNNNNRANNNAMTETTSIVQRNRNALAELKASLASIRNNSNNSDASFFQESLPTTRGESTIRALVASDVVNENIPVHNPPTSITANIRPFNAEAFEIAKKTFFESNNNNNNNEDINLGVKIRVKLSLNSESDRNQAQKTIDTIVQMMPPPVKATTTMAIGNDGVLTIAVAKPVDKSKSLEEQKDPLEKLFSVASRIASPGPKKKFGGGGGEEEAFAAALAQDGELPQQQQQLHTEGEFSKKTSPVDILRLATLRLDVPHDLSAWLQSNESSWATLVEGCRVAFEAVTHDASIEHAVADLAKTLLYGRSSPGGAKRSLLALIAMQSIKENSLVVKIAPPELLFGLAVQEASVAHRTSFLAGVAERNPTLESLEGTETGAEIDEFLQSDALESQVAAMIASKLKLGGTSTRLKRLLTYAFGAMFLTKGEKMGPLLDSIFFPMKNIIDEISSVALISRSGAVNVDIRGINSKLWSWVPNTSQAFFDLFKPVCLASWKDATFNADGTQLLQKDDPTVVICDGGSQHPHQIDKSFFVNPSLVFVAAMDEIIEKNLETVWPARSGKRPPSFVLRNPVMSFQKASKKTSTSSTYSSSSASAWDLPLPSELTNAKEGHAVGLRTLELQAAMSFAKNLVGGGSGGEDSIIEEINENAEYPETDENNNYNNNYNNNDDDTTYQEQVPAAEQEFQPPVLTDDFIDVCARGQFDQFDEDKSGYLEKAEAMSAFMMFYPDASATEVLARIRAADMNADGKLDYQEFFKIVKEILNGTLASVSSTE